MTQAELARILLTNERSVGRWEAGTFAPLAGTVGKIADALGIEVGDLYETRTNGAVS